MSDEEKYAEEEEMEPEVWNEEEEMEPEYDMDDESSDEIIIDISESEAQKKYNYLSHIINTYNAMFYRYPAQITSENKIIIQIPSDFIPTAQRFMYGFSKSAILLDIVLDLGDPCWTVPPVNFQCQHPILGTKFTGAILVKDAIRNFFTKEYKPREEYKSATALLTKFGHCDQDALKVLVSEGFDAEIAKRVLIQNECDVDKARSYLKTGKGIFPSKPPVNYNTCPLLYLILEICEAIIDISDHCVLCRKELSEPGVKPSICDSQLCNVRLTEIGIGTSLHAELKRDPAVADLLVSCFATAINGKHLKPHPHMESTDDPKTWKGILANMPPISALADGCASDREVAQRLGRAYSLLNWIVMSNRAHLVALPPELMLKEFNTRNQFLSLISNEQKEIKFRQLKAKGGSMYLWHGSSSVNWHSIIRNGLVNASNTEMMEHGAAYGSGIYLAGNLSVSKNYSDRLKNGYTNSRLGKEFQAVALCEVAKCCVKEPRTGIYTCQNEDAVVVRFILVGAWNDIDIVKNPPKDVPTIQDILNYNAR